MFRGAGKTHLARRSRCNDQYGIKTRFITAAHLMLRLGIAKAQARLIEYLNGTVPKAVAVHELSTPRCM